MSLFTKAAELMRQAAIRDLQGKISRVENEMQELTRQKKEYESFIEKAITANTYLTNASGKLTTAQEGLEKSYEGYKASGINSAIEGRKGDISSVKGKLNTYIETAKEKAKDLEQKIKNKQEYLDRLNRELSSLW